MDKIRQDWFEKWALYSPNKVAVSDLDLDKHLTYFQINNAGNHLADFLYNKGLRKGDRVAVLSEFSLEYITLFAAAKKSGLIIVPLNYRLAQREISFNLENSKPSIVFYESKFADLLVINDKCLDIQTLHDHWNKDQTGIKPMVNVDEDDPIFILYTSGTTGLPKGVLYTHKMMFWNSVQTAISLLLNKDSTTVNVMPPFHTGGWNVLLTPILHHGGHVNFFKKFDPNRVNEFIFKCKATIFMGVPTMLQMMAMAPNFSAEQFTSLMYIIVGGEPMPIPLIETYDQVGVAIRQGYGMTEVGPNLTSLAEQDAIRKKGSIGWPNFYVNTRVVNEEGKDVQVNELGELWLNGPMVTPGYWENTNATLEAFSEDGEWFKSGDLVKVDEEDYIYVVDRLKNMFISGAENIYPAEIERLINSLDQVAESVVIGVSDAKWGEVGKAIIAFKKGKDHLTEEQLKSFISDNIAKFKVPKYYAFLDELPKNDAGKLDRIKLKKMFIN